MKHLFLTTSVLAACLASATQAGVIDDRKAKFKENVAILRAIQTQISEGDFEAIAAGEAVAASAMANKESGGAHYIVPEIEEDSDEEDAVAAR